MTVNIDVRLHRPNELEVNSSVIVIAKAFTLDLTPALLEVFLKAHSRKNRETFPINLIGIQGLHESAVHILNLWGDYNRGDNQFILTGGYATKEKVALLRTKGWDLCNEDYARKHGLI